MMKNSVISLTSTILVCAVLVLGSCRNYKENYEDSEQQTNVNQKSFITIWETNKIDPSDKKIAIPVNPEYKDSYNYDIRWSKVTDPNTKGEQLNNTDGKDKVLTFPSAGRYKVEISGKFPAIWFHEDTISRKKLLSVEQWGDIKWKSMKSAFGGCKNLRINANDLPDLSEVTDMSNMFADTESFNQPIEKWDVSNVTNMSNMFFRARAFNQPIEKWNVSNVTNMSHMFDNASSFDQSIEKWDVGNVKSMKCMFCYAKAFNHTVEKWDIGRVDDMSNMFEDAYLFDQPLNDWSEIMRRDVWRKDMFKNAKSFSKRTRISSWNLDEDSCKELFGGKC